MAGAIDTLDRMSRPRNASSKVEDEWTQMAHALIELERERRGSPRD